MKNSKKTADAIHILLYIETNKNSPRITSEDIAEDLNVNASYVRQILSKLRKAKIIGGESTTKLSRKPIEISFYEIYKAVENNRQLFAINKKINFDSSNAIKIQQAISEYYNILQKSVEKNMKSITLAHIQERTKK